MMNEKEIAELLLNAVKDDKGRFINIEPVPKPDYCSDIVLRDLLLAMSVGDDFRIKPELQFVPYDMNDKEKLIGMTIITSDGSHGVIVDIDDEDIHFVYLGTQIMLQRSFNEARRNWTHLDGSVFSKLQRR